MDVLRPPFRFFLLLVAGQLNRRQACVIEYLLEENRLLLGPTRWTAGQGAGGAGARASLTARSGLFREPAQNQHKLPDRRPSGALARFSVTY